MPVADFLDGFEITRCRRHRTEGLARRQAHIGSEDGGLPTQRYTKKTNTYRASHSLRDERTHRLRAHGLKLILQLSSKSRYIRLVALAVILTAVRITGGDVRSVGAENRVVHLFAANMATHGQGAQRVAVIRLPASNETRSLRLLFGEFQKILSCNLQCSLDRLGSYNQETPTPLVNYGFGLSRFCEDAIE